VRLVEAGPDELLRARKRSRIAAASSSSIFTACAGTRLRWPSLLVKRAVHAKTIQWP
jgi:hypothetical protein